MRTVVAGTDCCGEFIVLAWTRATTIRRGGPQGDKELFSRNCDRRFACRRIEDKELPRGRPCQRLFHVGGKGPCLRTLRRFETNGHTLVFRFQIADRLQVFVEAGSNIPRSIQKVMGSSLDDESRTTVFLHFAQGGSKRSGMEDHWKIDSLRHVPIPPFIVCSRSGDHRTGTRPPFVPREEEMDVSGVLCNSSRPDRT